MSPSLLITDTHPLVWYLTAQFTRLPAKVKNAFDFAIDGKCAIFIPAVVLWELSLLMKAGKIRTEVSLEEYVQERFFARAISILNLETEDILLSQSLNFSRDPYDVLIVANALRLDCPLITGDTVIHKTRPCELFWD